MAEYTSLREKCELRCEEEGKDGLRGDGVDGPAVEVWEEMWTGTRGQR